MQVFTACAEAVCGLVNGPLISANLNLGSSTSHSEVESDGGYAHVGVLQAGRDIELKAGGDLDSFEACGPSQNGWLNDLFISTAHAGTRDGCILLIKGYNGLKKLELRPEEYDAAARAIVEGATAGDYGTMRAVYAVYGVAQSEGSRSRNTHTWRKSIHKRLQKQILLMHE